MKKWRLSSGAAVDYRSFHGSRGAANRQYNHIASDNPAAAQDVVDRIYKVADFLSTYPNSGRKTVFKDVRMFAVTPYPYVVFFRYVPKRGQIRILDVRHSARRRPALQEHAMEFRR